MEDKIFNFNDCFARAQELRQGLLLSWMEWSEVLGISYATLQRLKSGKSKPTYKTQRMIKAFVDEYQGKI